MDRRCHERSWRHVSTRSTIRGIAACSEVGQRHYHIAHGAYACGIHARDGETSPQDGAENHSRPRGSSRIHCEGQQYDRLVGDGTWEEDVGGTRGDKVTFPKRTHCLKGHELCSGDVYVYPSTGKRTCLIW